MKTQCPGCKAKFNVNEQSVGKRAKCPKCSQSFVIEPFIDTSVETPAKVDVPIKAPKAPIEASAKITEPVKAAEPTAEKKPESKKLSKTLYVYCWAAVRIIAGAFGVLGVILALKKVTNSVLISVFAAGDVFLIASVLIELALIYKMYSAIQNSGEVSTTPAKAVGFLFIPVFNIYWALYIITGFVEDCNALILRQKPKTKELPITLFFVYAVMFLLSAVFITIPSLCVFAIIERIGRAFLSYPVLSWLLFALALAVGLGHFIAYMLYVAKTCSAINTITNTSTKNS